MRPVESRIHQGILPPGNGTARIEGLRRRRGDHQAGTGPRREPLPAAEALAEHETLQKGRVGAVRRRCHERPQQQQQQQCRQPAAGHGDDPGTLRPSGTVRQHGTGIPDGKGKPVEGDEGRKNVRDHTEGGEGQSVGFRGLLPQRREAFHAVVGEQHLGAPGIEHREPTEKTARARRQVGIPRKTVKIAANEHEGIVPAMNKQNKPTEEYGGGCASNTSIEIRRPGLPHGERTSASVWTCSWCCFIKTRDS
mmetsp:Transcript_27544/g.60768  ORF Transcript_27544/g.60768 Transcript_27544/m.60768 type:complete len:251 (-) Transcript_27544:1025-1777(-)